MLGAIKNRGLALGLGGVLGVGLLSGFWALTFVLARDSIAGCGRLHHIHSGKHLHPVAMDNLGWYWHLGLSMSALISCSLLLRVMLQSGIEEQDSGHL